jgi:RNA polymerase sigma-70 factor (sigma-E family)
MMGAVVLGGGAADRSAHDELAALFVAEHDRLVRLAVLLLGDQGAAEEVVQDAFVSLHRNWRRVRDPERAPAWLRSAVLNGARSRLRRLAVRRRHPDPPGALAPGADEAALDADRRSWVLAALAQLPARQREALVLRYYLDLSEAEIAGAMGVSAGSVKVHVHRGLAALRARPDAEEGR